MSTPRPRPAPVINQTFLSLMLLHTLLGSPVDQPDRSPLCGDCLVFVYTYTTGKRQERSRCPGLGAFVVMRAAEPAYDLPDFRLAAAVGCSAQASRRSKRTQASASSNAVKAANTRPPSKRANGSSTDWPSDAPARPAPTSRMPAVNGREGTTSLSQLSALSPESAAMTGSISSGVTSKMATAAGMLRVSWPSVPPSRPYSITRKT